MQAASSRLRGRNSGALLPRSSSHLFARARSAPAGASVTKMVSARVAEKSLGLSACQIRYSTTSTREFECARSARCSAGVSLQSSGTSTPPQKKTAYAEISHLDWLLINIAARSSGANPVCWRPAANRSAASPNSRYVKRHRSCSRSASIRQISSGQRSIAPLTAVPSDSYWLKSSRPVFLQP